MNDFIYLRERALKELRAAISATDYRVRLVHLEMADAYSNRLRQLQTEERRSRIHLVDAA